MKASELMIGDWVMSKDLKVPVKVRSIMNNYGTSIYFYHEASEYIVQDFQIEPIPLTSEILEKNGFNSVNKCIFEIPISKEDLIRLIHIGDGWTVDTKIYAKGVNIMYGYFNYVHELQHALKLCEIEKEIIL